MRRTVGDIGRLTRQEHDLWDMFVSGELLDLRTLPPCDRVIRAEVIRALLLGARPPEPGRAAGIRLCGARIVGDLDLSGCQTVFPLSMTGCEIGSVLADNATLRSTVLRGSRIAVFTLVDGRLDGLLDLRECKFVEPTDRDYRIRLDGTEFSGSVTLSRAEIRGQVRCVASVIKGRLRLNGTKIDNGTRVTLNGPMVSTGSQLAAKELHSVGEINLNDARLGGRLMLDGALLVNKDGTALSGRHLTVAAEVSARATAARPFESDGLLSIPGARVAGGVDMNGAVLHQGLDMSGATVAQTVIVSGVSASTSALNLAGVRIARRLDLSGMKSPDAHLNLSGAAITEIHDAGIGDWPSHRRLDGLTYDSLTPLRPVAERLRLLEDQPGGYRPGPYEQLAAHCRRLGHDDEARHVLLARHRARRADRRRWRRVPGYVADALTGYGYRPGRAAVWALGLLLFGTAFFARYRPEPVHPEDHPVFNPLLYCADRLVPLVRLGPADVWRSSGMALLVGSGLTVAGWALGIAIAAGATRALSRD